MTIQFYCPQCNQMLQADPSQQGQQSQCPMCNTVFIIPTMEAPAGVETGFPGVHGSIGHFEQPAPAPEPEPVAEPEPQAPEEPAVPKVFRIICQQCKQELQTPEDMLGQMAMCPYCNNQFELQYEDSIEYQEEQQQAKIDQEKQREQFWLKWAIRSAIGVGVMLLLMVLWVILKPYL